MAGAQRKILPDQVRKPLWLVRPAAVGSGREAAGVGVQDRHVGLRLVPDSATSAVVPADASGHDGDAGLGNTEHPGAKLARSMIIP
jgi:hypothetical protein